MNRIDATFEKLRQADQAAFIPFVTAGDPDLDTTAAIIRAAEMAGADILELGFPFSDPIADGPVIQASYTRALAAGQRTEDVFRTVQSLRAKSGIPIVAMISYSLVFRMGFEAFLDRACRAGIDGATIPDLPIEESEPFHEAAEQRGFRLICFVTPATNERRRSMILRLARGFIYYISVRGITGERMSVPDDLADNIRELKSRTDVPIAVGFGISTPRQATVVARLADGVIVGSALVKRIHEAVESGHDPVMTAALFVAQMSAAAKERMRPYLLEPVESLMADLEVRDPYAGAHRWRVVKLARAIAESMELPADRIDSLVLAANIHNVGTLRIPIGILSKRGRLSQEELDVVKTHPRVGAEMLESEEFPARVAQIVRQHHERLDGSGYGAGLSREEIMLEARILAVADCVAAMTSERPHRPALGVEDALREISDSKGTLYDPDVVDVCVKLFKEKGFTL